LTFDERVVLHRLVPLNPNHEPNFRPEGSEEVQLFCLDEADTAGPLLRQVHSPLRYDLGQYRRLKCPGFGSLPCELVENGGSNHSLRTRRPFDEADTAGPLLQKVPSEPAPGLKVRVFRIWAVTAFQLCRYHISVAAFSRENPLVDCTILVLYTRIVTSTLGLQAGGHAVLQDSAAAAAARPHTRCRRQPVLAFRVSGFRGTGFMVYGLGVRATGFRVEDFGYSMTTRSVASGNPQPPLHCKLEPCFPTPETCLLAF